MKNIFVKLGCAAILALTGTYAVANYTATQGTGTNFGSIIVGAVHYTQNMICDLTTPGQCAAVSAGGAVSVNVTNAPSGQVTAANSQSVVLASDNNTVTAVGTVAAGAADNGNPLKIGGIYNTTKPTLTNGLRGDAQLGSRGALVVQMVLPDSTTGPTQFSGPTDGFTNGASGVYTGAMGWNFNGTTWDRARNNIDTAALITLTAAAAGTVNSADQTNYNGRGAQFGINLTVDTTCSTTINIQGKDIASATYYNILSSAALVTAAFSNLTVYPGAGVTANVSSSQPLPRTWRVQAVNTGVSCAVTGTVGASVID